MKSITHFLFYSVLFHFKQNWDTSDISNETMEFTITFSILKFCAYFMEISNIWVFIKLFLLITTYKDRGESAIFKPFIFHIKKNDVTLWRYCFPNAPKPVIILTPHAYGKTHEAKLFTYLTDLKFHLLIMIPLTRPYCPYPSKLMYN